MLEQLEGSQCELERSVEFLLTWNSKLKQQVGTEQDTLPAASPNLRTAVFLPFPVIPKAVSILHTDCAGNPLQPSLPSFLPTIFLLKAWS